MSTEYPWQSSQVPQEASKRPLATSAEIVSASISGGSFIVSFFSFGISLASLFASCSANNIATEANRIAIDANKVAAASLRQAQKQHDENTGLQNRMKELEIWLKKPRLTMIQRLLSTDGRLAVTLQNEGERDAALLQLQVHRIGGQSIQTATTDGPTTMPVETLAETIKANLVGHDDSAPYYFAPPRIVKAGSVVNLDIRLPTAPAAGEVVLYYADGETLYLGSFYWEAAAATSPSDPFRSPAPASQPPPPVAPAAPAAPARPAH